MPGYRAGDTFTWDTPAGARSMKVESVLARPDEAAAWRPRVAVNSGSGSER